MYSAKSLYQAAVTVVNKILPKNVNLKKSLIVCLVLVAVGACMSFYGVPKIVKTIVKFLCVLKPGRFVRNKHEMKLPFTYKLYLWNVTNPDEIMAGTAKPKMQEIGPYVFSQSKQNIETLDDETADTYEFDLWNIYHFNPELSAPLTGNEQITFVHIVIVAAAVKVKLESPHLQDTLMEALDIIFQNPSSIFMTMKAIDFIDKGVEINCSQTAYAATQLCRVLKRHKVLKIVEPSEENVNSPLGTKPLDGNLLRYRWFDKLNNSIQARYTVMRGVQNIHDVGQITAVRGKPKLNVFKHDDKCNVINGTDKLFYPPFQKKNDVVWVYSDDACKSFPLRFQYEQSVRGMRTAWKSLNISDSSLMDPLCECDSYAGCFLPGTIDMYYCLDIFVMGSLPHFYSTDPRIRETLEGMHPNEALHKTGIYFDLLTGSPILTFERYQVSWLVKRIPEYPIFSSIAGDVWIPVLWYEESFSIPKADLALLIFSRISKTVGIVTGVILMVVGVLGIIVLAIRFHYQTSIKPENGIQSTK
ncbi:Sensory neuron membrane protein 1 [Pseudolycoriella hygida]|uniref:Sensory neuron membrane protein 1 n=1 Tax=Pseudolycoriella hygida TaxID=35572 RepID=A0A9Q0MR77_9DIPT|nr:Sensory neuron membrane protein 1 [Pseudolycoriella hygida]